MIDRRSDYPRLSHRLVAITAVLVEGVLAYHIVRIQLVHAPALPERLVRVIVDASVLGYAVFPLINVVGIVLVLSLAYQVYDSFADRPVSRRQFEVAAMLSFLVRVAYGVAVTVVSSVSPDTLGRALNWRHYLLTENFLVYLLVFEVLVYGVLGFAQAFVMTRTLAGWARSRTETPSFLLIWTPFLLMQASFVLLQIVYRG